jgi:hypothetical protein
LKVYLTKEQAVSVLPDGETIHTFLNPGFGLVGADWERDDILDKIEKSDIVELTGPGARGMGHGICAYNKGTKWQSEILFIETDEKKLSALEKELGCDTNE